MLGGAADIVLDEGRGRLYLVNTAQNRVDVYSLAQRRFLSPIQTSGTPIAGALSRSGKTLYVTVFDAASLLAIDLDSSAVTSRLALPAKPEGVAVGSDERVLISTIGTGSGNSQNVLLIYDPSATGPSAIGNVSVTPPPPQPPQLPPPGGRQFLETRSQLASSADGNYIVGVNVPANNSRSVFLYEVSSGTVLRSRTVLNASSVLGVAPDGSKFMAGSTLFDAQTLQVLAQENLANAPYLVQPNTQFNVQTNQGGSVFSPDGNALYAAFDIAPVTNPPSRPNISQLMLNSPDNLLIQSALQLPENLTGKMVITSDGGTIYALSESGFTVIPIGNMGQSPLAVPDNTAVLLANDQCGVTASQRSQRVGIFNAGKGRMTASAQVVQLNPTGPVGIGGGFGAGGGIIGGGGVIIILPPAVPGGGAGGTVIGPVIPGGPNPGTTNTAIAQGAPQARSVQFPDGMAIDFTFNPLAARAPGTIPSHDFVIQSPEAINIPPRVRVYQNNRDAEARGDIIPVPVGISANEALEDLLYDPQRGRIYIANSGMNRVEIFDTRQKQFLSPIAVGQLPHSLALDGSTLYVANTGGESITTVDVDKLQATGRITFPALAFNASSALVTPSAVAAGLRGPLVMMSNGILWQVVGNQAVPRPVSSVIGSVNGAAQAIAAPRSMAATPGGEYILVLGGDGSAYLYDSLADDFVRSRQLTSLQQSTGYFGPVTAGPRGQYFVVNGVVLNQALTPLNTPQVPQRGGPLASSGRPVAAVAPVSATTFARFTQPLRTNNQIASDPGQVEIVDVNSGAPQRTAPSMEGPLSQPLTTGRAVVEPRTMAVDANGTSAYILTTSGLSIVPLDAPAAPSDRPQVYPNGAVNLASYLPVLDPNGLISLFGRNLAGPDMASATPLPNILGGVCVTANNQPLPLFMTSPGQINAQLGPDLKTGNYSVVVRSIDRHIAAPPVQITLSKYAPAVFVDGSGQAAVLHRDGAYVTKDRPAHRDESLVVYATGLGPTKGGSVTGGTPAPSDNPAVLSDKLQVFFGDSRLKQSEMIVEWAGLAPGLVGVYQVNVRVPGDRSRGDALPVLLKIGGVQSPVTGPAAPVVAVD